MTAMNQNDNSRLILYWLLVTPPSQYREIWLVGLVDLGIFNPEDPQGLSHYLQPQILDASI